MAKKTKEAKVEVKETTKVHEFEKIFTIVERNGNYNIAVGNKIVSKLTFISLEETQDYINSKPWELIINATCCIYDLAKEIKK